MASDNQKVTREQFDQEIAKVRAARHREKAEALVEEAARQIVEDERDQFRA